MTERRPSALCERTAGRPTSGRAAELPVEPDRLDAECVPCGHRVADVVAYSSIVSWSRASGARGRRSITAAPVRASRTGT
jgi:hypothetical protein